MQRILVLLLASTCCFAAVPRFSRKPFLDGRIVGGREADIEDFPYQLSLRSYNSHICGASIIGPNTALTAAHCVDGAFVDSVSFRAGSSNRNQGGSIHYATKITVNDNYNYFDIDYDVAVVEVSPAFPIGSRGVQAVSLINFQEELQPGTPANVSGWGTTRFGSNNIPNTLREVKIPIVNSYDCDSAYGGGITDRMICAGYLEGGKDACQGDSGGPLVSNGRQVGIVSWGIGCAQAGYPGVYSKISALRDWIQKHAGI